MIPSLGRVVEYTLSVGDAMQIKAQRSAVGHERGNTPQAGERYPLIMTRVWGGTDADGRPVAYEHTAVNGQVMLDGNDTHWVTSRTQGDGEGNWREFARV